MQVTAIKKTQQTKSGYEVYVDGGYAFTLSPDALLDTKLVVGQQLDVQQLQAYQILATRDKAYGLTLSYVARRMRSRWELTNYFSRKGYDESMSQQLLERLERIGMVNDAKFAEAWVHNRRMLKQASRHRLVQELRQKHVDDDVIEQALSGDQVNEHTLLRTLIVRKRKQTRYQDDRKLIQYLARQGFRYEDIVAAIKDAP